MTELEKIQAKEIQELKKLLGIKKEEKATKEKIDKLLKEATIQLNTYEKDELVIEHLKQAKLKKLALVFHGWKLVEIKEV